MLDRLEQLDKELFLALNGLGSPWLDGFMIFMSEKHVWIPLYLLLIFFLAKKYTWTVYQPLLVIGLVLLCTDQTTSSIMKPFFERFRPCKDPEMDGLVHIIDKCRGLYGFASGHAANSFGMAGFFYFSERSKKGIALLIWASVVAYSRVYLGVHYPGDVVVGAGIGLFSSFIWVMLYKRAAAKSEHIHFL